MSRSFASSLAMLLVASASLLRAQDTPPRRLTPTPIPLSTKLATISGVHELRDGRLIVTDGKNAGVYIVDPSKNTMTQLGTVGGDELQYTQPGGFYAAAGDTTFLLDRGQAKVLVLSPSGTIVGSQSVKRRGVTESSSADVDRQRIDARGHAYFTLRGMLSLRQGQSSGDSVALVRFDAAKQHAETVAFLRTHDTKIVQASENMQITQAVSGSPMDEWGVASSGRVAIVRGSPYRVDWIEPNGRLTHGHAYAVSPIAFTQAEKDSITTASQQSRASIGMPGGATTTTGNQPYRFADAKAPFADNDVAVSSDGQVWVARSQPFGVENTTYDVFNAEGERVDRVQLAGHARVIGFSSRSVYVVVRGRGGEASLAKYPR